MSTTEQTETIDRAPHDEAYVALLGRISHQSVVKHFDAYADIEWDDPALAIDPTDPRWELGADEGLGATAWYRELRQQDRARLGLDLVAMQMKVGLGFENILKQGLLQFAQGLPNRSPEFRYAYHELIEEAQHSLMFQEFVNRSGSDPVGLSRLDRTSSRFVVSMARWFPPLFFVFVLGGEDPIDHVQRRELRSGRDLHPLLWWIMRIHVTEEARHLAFARHYLLTHVPRLGRTRRMVLGIVGPLILATMVQMMLRPSRQIVAQHQIPRRVLTEAYVNDPTTREQTLEALRKVRALFDQLGLLSRGYQRLWRVLGLWPEDA
jgi:hypothetical protein